MGRAGDPGRLLGLRGLHGLHVPLRPSFAPLPCGLTTEGWLHCPCPLVLVPQESCMRFLQPDPGLLAHMGCTGALEYRSLVAVISSPCLGLGSMCLMTESLSHNGSWHGPGMGEDHQGQGS